MPEELSPLFHETDFQGYPLVHLPQQFVDYRGSISNIADGKLGDVAVISSVKGSVRANHYHKNDWHLSYLISGKMEYRWLSLDSQDHGIMLINEGRLFYTPPNTIHRMTFLEDSIFVAVSKLGRNQENYEADTIRTLESRLEFEGRTDD